MNNMAMKIALAPIGIRPYLRPLQGQVSDASRPEAALDTIKSALRKLSAMGYDGIEMNTPSEFGSPQAFRAFLDEIRFEILTCGGLTYDELRFGDLRSKIEECKVLGAKNVMIGSMPSLCLGNYDELLRFCRAMNRAGEILGGEGIALSYHNHAVDFSKIKGERMIDIILGKTDPKWVFLEMDTHWVQAGGGHVVSWIKQVAGRMKFIHFKDYAIDEYSDTVFVGSVHKLWAEVGQGNLNWPGIIEACDRTGVQWCAVEQDVIRRPGFEACKISVDYLRGFGLGGK
jgi:sugar phosphate isomerase/epimerase